MCDIASTDIVIFDIASTLIISKANFLGYSFLFCFSKQRLYC